MGTLIGAINDDYHEYESLCREIGIEPKDTCFWSYDDTEIVKMVKKGNYTYDQACAVVTLKRKHAETIKALKKSCEAIDSAVKLLGDFQHTPETGRTAVKECRDMSKELQWQYETALFLIERNIMIRDELGKNVSDKELARVIRSGEKVIVELALDNMRVFRLKDNPKCDAKQKQ